MLALTLAFAATSAAQSVTLSSGTLLGGQCDSSDALYFYSIPFAQPPTGDLRFAPPLPYEGLLDGVDATAESPKCPQFSSFIETGNISEDCLYLNVWAPPEAEGLPVKVWIYGGGNGAGSISNPTYDGCNLATDSVVVSVNYRLGPLGFLGLQDYGIQGNMGIQDQLLGLQWVQDNIEAFGGDPSQVLLFGQSAGASDTYIIGSLPGTPELINAAIAESGGGRIYPEADATNAFGLQYAQSLDCNDLACLQAKPLSALNISLEASSGLPDYNPYKVDSVGPFVDGTIVAAQPLDVGPQVPFIFGSTTQEGTLGLLADSPDPSSITTEAYASYLQTTFGPAASLVASQYPVAAFNSTPFPAFFALTQVITETSYFCPAYAALNSAASHGVPVWTYRWAQAPTCPWYEDLSVEGLPLLGATHTAEIPFVFANVLDNPPPDGSCDFTAAEQALSTQFVEFWTSMATSASPGDDWPTYSIDASRGLNVLDGSSSATPGVVDYSVCAFWDRVRSVVLQGANGTATGSPSASSSGPGIVAATGGARSNLARIPTAMASLTAILLCAYLLIDDKQ